MLSSCIHDPRSCKKLLKKNSGVPRFVPDSVVCVCVYIFRRSKKKKDVACRGIFGAALWNQRALVTDVDLEKYYVR